jgi:2,4-dienoyl-CoA reductase-like NADH-dependent reductase (Old Yellow Enzyme family)
MSHPDLYSPLVFPGGIQAKNRLLLAAMTNQQSHQDGSLSDDELSWLERRARGGFGSIATCASHVALDGQGWAGELGIFDDRLIPGLTRVASMLKQHGSLGFVQIFHGGVRAPSALTGQQPWSASAFTESTPGFEAPRAATEEDIQRVIGQFRDAAVRAHKAGFEGVELHGAHGYLLGQFLSRTMNLREDGWGGSFENRARLLRETLRAVRAAVPAPFVVGVRISPEDRGQTRGVDLDESLQLARWLADDGLDFLHISLWDVTQPTRKRPAEHPVPLFRAVLPRAIPLVVAGNVWTRQDADAQLALGADGVALGRPAIGNPEWPLRAMDPSWQPDRPPFSVDQLIAQGLNPTFAGYMRRWTGFVRD